MKTNIGIVKSIISKKLTDSFIKNGHINESKNIASSFFEIIKHSPILQLEFKIYNNIENKYINNEAIAVRYIDNNLKLFENINTDQIINEHKKLEGFIDENAALIDTNKQKLYNAIENLLYENSKKNEVPNIDLIHESFIDILSYVMSNKKPETVNEAFIIDENMINDNLIKLSIDKFNEKYSNLSSSEINLIKKITTLSDAEKENALNEWKKDVINTLNSVGKNGIEDKINESIDKINKMNFNPQTVTKNIIDLYELKNNLG